LRLLYVGCAILASNTFLYGFQCARRVLPTCLRGDGGVKCAATASGAGGRSRCNCALCRRKSHCGSGWLASLLDGLAAYTPAMSLPTLLPP